MTENMAAVAEQTTQRTAEEIAEIERHKYYLSEKAGYDVGWDHAASDWDATYGKPTHEVPDVKWQARAAQGLSRLVKQLLAKRAA